MHAPGPGPGAAPPPQEPRSDDGDLDEAPHVPIMQKTTPDAAALLEKAQADKRARQEGPDSSGVSDERMRELKEKARASIESRLVAKRKQRRLLRGGDLPRTKKR